MIPLATVLPPLLRADDRPVLSGPVETVEAPPFLLHFTREGADAPPARDDDGDGIPDLVTTYRDALLAAEAGYAGDGWRALAPDPGGDSDDIDVYVQDLPVYGYATPIPAGDGSWSCHLRLDPANATGGGVAASVATHELHHCVQFRYTAQGPTWLFESAATREQYARVVDPALDVASGVLWREWLEHTEVPLTATDGRREYAAFVFTKFWDERGGREAGRLPAFWEALADPEEGTPSWIPTLDREARRVWGTDLGATFLDHAVWNAFACGADDGRHYDPAVVPCIVSSTVVAPDLVDDEPIEHEDGPFTAAYRRVPVEGPVAVRCDGEPGLRAALVSVGSMGEAVEVAALDPVAELRITEGGSALLVVVGTEEPLSAICRTVPVSAAFGSGCDTAGGGGWWWSAVPLLLGWRRRCS